MELQMKAGARSVKQLLHREEWARDIPPVD